MDAVRTGGLIAQVRKEKELTQKDLAERLHVSVQAVSKWERGLSCPDIGLLEPLAEALDLTVTELLSGQRGEAPGEEAVRDSLRFGENQLRPKIRRWKWLFLAAAMLLLALAAAVGYVWVRDNTEWLPQRETVVSPTDITGRENIMLKVLSEGKRDLYLYDLTLADSLSALTVQVELWTDGRMEKSWLLMGDYYSENWDGEEWDLLPTAKASIHPDASPRRRVLALALEPDYNGEYGETGRLDYTLCFLSSTGVETRPGSIEDIPHMTGGMLGVHPLKEKSAADPEEGVVLLAWSLQGEDRYWHTWGTDIVEGSAFLAFKLYCK